MTPWAGFGAVPDLKYNATLGLKITWSRKPRDPLNSPAGRPKMYWFLYTAPLPIAFEEKNHPMRKPQSCQMSTLLVMM